MFTYVRWASLATLAIGATACGVADDLLDVDAPSRVLSSSLEDPATAPLLTRSVQATFECAFGVDQGRPVRLRFAELLDIDNYVRASVAVGETAASAVEQRLR